MPVKVVKGKVLSFLSEIRNNGYTKDELNDIEAFQNKLKTDMGTDDINEALTILGYLIKHEYIRIVPGEGIALASDAEVLKIIEKMIKDFEN